MAKPSKVFQDVKNNYIKSTGKDVLSETDPEYAEVLARVNEALEAEVDIETDPILELSDLDDAGVSARDIDLLIGLNLLAEPKDA